MAPPQSDNKGAGYYLPAQPRGWWGISNAEATTQAGEPAHGGVGPFHSVWWVFEVYHIGTYTFSIERTWGGLDPVLAAYKNVPFSGFAGITELDSDGASALPTISFTVTEADRFSEIAIVVASKAAGDYGGCILTWDFVPDAANNSFETPTLISGSGSVTDVGFDGADYSHLDPWPEYFDNASGNHWYKAEPSADGSLKITLTNKYAFTFYNDLGARIWKGTDPKTMEVVGNAWWWTGGNIPVNSTQSVSVPVEAGETYYVEVYGDLPETPIAYSLAWVLNTDVGVDFQPATLGDFSSNTGGSGSGGSFTFAPGQFATKTLYGSGHLRANDDHYICFNVWYGNSTRITPTSGDGTIPILRVKNPAGTVIWQAVIWETLAENGSNDQLAFGSQGTLSGFKVSETPLFVEVFISKTAYSNHIFDVIVNGHPVHYSVMQYNYGTGELGSVEIGYIVDNNVSDLDLRISDVRIKDVLWDPIPDPPWGTQPKHRVLGGSGYTATGWPTTGMGLSASYSSAVADPTGMGMGKVLPTGNSAVMREMWAHKSLSWGAWFYWGDIIGLNQTIISLEANEDPNTFFDETLSVIVDDGECYVDLPGSYTHTLGERASWYAHRKLEVGSWNFIELSVDEIYPRMRGRLWINGELQAEWTEPRSVCRQFTSLQTPYVAIGSTGTSGYIGTHVYGLKGPIGPVKAVELLPNASGTHNTTPPWDPPNDNPNLGPLPEGWFTTTDNGNTWTSMDPSTAIHQLLDENPPVTSGSSDFVGNATMDAGAYAQIGYQDVANDETVLKVTAFNAYRAMRTLKSDGGLIEDASPDFQPWTTGGYGGNAEFDQKYIVGGEEIVQSAGFHTFTVHGPGSMQTDMPATAPSREAWTPTLLNDLVARWGFHNGWDGQNGNAWLASRLEVLLAEAAPEMTLPVFTMPAPTFETRTTLDTLDNYTTTLDSCDGPIWTNRGHDPQMYNKVWWQIWFQPYNDGETIWWRVVPAYDPDVPGLDGTFTDQGLSITEWTIGGKYRKTFNRQEQLDVHWMTPHITEPRVKSNTLIYNACSTDKLDVNRQVRIEAYTVDQNGVASPTATLTLDVEKGLCCIDDLYFSTVFDRGEGVGSVATPVGALLFSDVSFDRA